MANPQCDPALNITVNSADISGTADNIPPTSTIELAWGENNPGGPYPNVADSVVGDNSVGQPVAASLAGLSPSTQYCYQVRVRDNENPMDIAWVEGPPGIWTLTFTNGTVITLDSFGPAGVVVNGAQCEPPISGNALRFRGGPSTGKFANFSINQPTWGPSLGLIMYDFDNFTVSSERFRSPSHGLPDAIPPGYTTQPGDWVKSLQNDATDEFTWNNPAGNTFSLEFDGDCFGVDFALLFDEASTECCFFTDPPIPTCEPATSITQTSATLNGEANDMPVGFSFKFLWGTVPGGPYGSESPLIPSNGAPVQNFSFPIAGLAPNTTYYYIVQAIDNLSGDPISQSSECNFTTEDGVYYCGALFDPASCTLVDPGNGEPYLYCITI